MTTIDPETHRRLAPHEILREGDLNCGAHGLSDPTPTFRAGDAVTALGLAYYRQIRPSPKPGYRWADEGEECRDWLDADGSLAVIYGSSGGDWPQQYPSGPAGAVMPWPEDPRLEGAENPSPPDSKSEKQRREEREREAWEEFRKGQWCTTKPSRGGMTIYAARNYGEDAVFLNPGGIAMLRDALNHRLRELGVEE